MSINHHVQTARREGRPIQNASLRVLITGGSRGLGRAIAERLAGEGATLGLIAREAGPLEEALASIRELGGGGTGLGLVCDVLDQQRLGMAFARFREWAGGIDALICAAGQLKGIGPLATVDPQAWWRDLETSVRGVQHSIREAMLDLRKSDKAIIAVLVGPGHDQKLPYASGYAAGQAALTRLVESLAPELGREGIRIYAVNPGLIATELVRGLIDTHEGRRWLPQFNEAFAEGKEVDSGVVAEMVSWLVANRPLEASGRVVAAPMTPEILALRLARLQEENLGVLRLR